MKKNYFVLLIALLFVAKGIAQQVEERQRSLITKRTADWCPHCGTWGWNYFTSAIEQNGDKAVYISAHFDGALANDAAADITSNFGGVSQPRLYFNAADQGVTSGNVSAKLQALKTLVDEAYEQAPVVNCGLEPKYQNGEIGVQAKVKFFQAAEGEFHLGLYLIENNVKARQASIGDNAIHKRLFRKSFTSESFGLPIINGNVSAGQEFDLDFSVEGENPLEHEYEVVGIIWKKEGSKYVPVNVWSTTQISLVSSTLAPEQTSELTITPSVASDFAVVELMTNSQFSQATLQVVSMDGRVVSTLHDGPLAAGQNRFEINRKAVGQGGLYLVRLQAAGLVKTGKVVFR